ncbi:hypothetical protein D3C83_186150 [compost metagenome]
MLSKTEDRKPSPRAVIADAAGSLSTGIMVAESTRQSRKSEPLNASGSRLQFGRRIGAVASNATQTAAPMNGRLSACSG